MDRSRNPWPALFVLALSPLVVGLVVVGVSGGNSVANDVGSSLIGGSLIGLIFVLVQYTIDRLSQKQEARAALLLMLNSTHELPGIDLSGRSLARSYLRGRNLTRARLDGCDLSGADLSESTLDGADLRNATLSGTVLGNASLKGTDLTGCSLPAADLSGADLEQATLVGARLDNADLRGAHLVAANLSRSLLRGTDLRETDLTGAQLTGVQAGRAQLGRAVLASSTLALGDFTEANLSRARLVGADLTGAQLARAVLIRADLRGAILTGCSLAGANLDGARLTGAVLTSVDLTGAMIGGCDLRGADLSTARLVDLQGLANRRTDSATRWPPGWGVWPDDVPHSVPAAIYAPGWAPARGSRRLVVTADSTLDGSQVDTLVAELDAQQRLAMVRRQSPSVSLPLGVRAPQLLSVNRSGRLTRWRWNRAVLLKITLEGRPGAQILKGSLHRGPDRISLGDIPIDQRPTSTPGAVEYPSVTEELAARTFSLVDPRDNAPWRSRAHTVRAMRAWDADLSDSSEQCERELRAALTVDPLGPVANYAFAALSYNKFEHEATRLAVEGFAVANASRDRLSPALQALIGLTLSGLSLANSQLYHRFEERSASVLSASRTAAVMAVSNARHQLARRRLSAQQQRNALIGYALARSSEAFSLHITELPADVKASIPLYREAIATLQAIQVPVLAAMFNNLGYQYLTLAGRFEPGPDRAGYLKARELFDLARQSAPEYVFAWANLGNADRQLGRLADSESSFRKALHFAEARGMDYPQGWNELAKVLLELGRIAEAAIAHQKALDSTSAKALRARLSAEYADNLIRVGRPEAAIDCLHLALAEFPDNAQCLNIMAEARESV